MVKKCCVRNCSSESYGGCNISFHGFPKNEEMRHKWLKSLHVTQRITKNSVVCSRHFEPNFFYTANSRRLLKADIVPTIVSVHDITSLKSERDNMKAFIQKDGPSIQQGAIKTMVEEPERVTIKKEFDSNEAKLYNNKEDHENGLTNLSGSNVYNTVQDKENVQISEVCKIQDESCEEVKTPQIDVQDWRPSLISNNTNAVNSCRPTDYTRREAIMRLKIIRHKKKMQMQILKTQLETEIIKKETSLIMLEKAKLELKTLKMQ